MPRSVSTVSALVKESNPGYHTVFSLQAGILGCYVELVKG